MVMQMSMSAGLVHMSVNVAYGRRVGATKARRMLLFRRAKPRRSQQFQRQLWQSCGATRSSAQNKWIACRGIRRTLSQTRVRRLLPSVPLPKLQQSLYEVLTPRCCLNYVYIPTALAQLCHCWRTARYRSNKVRIERVDIKDG